MGVMNLDFNKLQEVAVKMNGESSISREEVKHVAVLAELDFSDEQIREITPKLAKIISHVAMISKADTGGIEPTSHVVDIKNVLREDIVKPSLDQRQALLNAPAEEEKGFRVPKID